MDYGAIIKRAWHLMWRHKALWVLGVFAGVSGCQSGWGGSSGWSGSGRDWNQLQTMRQEDWSWQFDEALDVIGGLIPALIALSVLILALALVWWIFSVAARGGLIVAVSEIEDGRPRDLGELWKAGFSRFWRLVGLGLLLNLPLMVAGIVLAAIVALSVAGPLASGSDLSPAVSIAPICGTLVLGIPLAIVAGVVLGIMYLIGQRYIMLGGQGPIEAAGNAWRFLRARTKDTLLMYLLSGALNLAAGMVIAIPMVVVGIGLGVPIALGAIGRNWGLVGGLVLLAFGAVSVVSIGYTAVWGTFSSALWTLFFRDLTGMAALTAPAPMPMASPGYAEMPATTEPYLPPPAPPVADA